MKTTFKFLLLICMAGLSLVACKKEQEEPSLSVNKTSLSYVHAGEALSLAVTSNTKWAAIVSSGAAWLTLNMASGEGNKEITATATANTTVVARTATITISAGDIVKTVAVTQAAGNATLNVSPETLSFTNGAETKTITVTSNDKWTVSVDSKQGTGWLKFSATSGTANGTFTVTSSANSTTATRTAIITVTTGSLSKTVDVTQAIGDATLSVSPASLSFVKGGEGKPITVTSNSAWTAAVSAGAAWLTLNAASGNGNGTLTATATANTTTAVRTATITFQGGNSSRIGKTVTVTQAAGDATVNVSTNSLNFAIAGGTQSITVTSNTSWAITKDVDWLTLSATSGNGNGSFTITATTNAILDLREGHVTVGNKVITVKQATTGLSFQDPKFKAALIKAGCDNNSDGAISFSEARARTSLNVNEADITNMGEIAYFVNITDLACFNNRLTTLDLSYNTELKTLSCAFNLLMSINVTACTKLQTMYCHSNKIAGILDVSKNTQLTVLNSTGNMSLAFIKVWPGFVAANYPGWVKDAGVSYYVAP